MSETIDLQPVIAKLSDSPDKQQEQTLRKELLDLQVTLKSDEEDEKTKAIDDIKSKLDEFELTISSEKAISAELQASIDKAQSEIIALEAARKAEENKVVDEGAGETKSLWDQLTTSDNPEQTFTTRWKGRGKKFLGFLGIGTALTGLASKASGDKTGESAEATKSFFTKAKEWVIDLFGLSDDVPTEKADVSAETNDIGTEKHKELIEQVKKMNIEFKDPTPSTTDVNENKDRLALLSTKTLATIKGVGEKFPWVRITSTLRSKKENSWLEESAENSKHMYGFAFDIGADLREPAQYTFEEVQEFVTSNHPSSKTLIHWEGANRHLHVETDESTDGKTIYETDEDIKNVLTPELIA